jgi:hypothetical protein
VIRSLQYPCSVKRQFIMAGGSHLRRYTVTTNHTKDHDHDVTDKTKRTNSNRTTASARA